MRKVTFVGMAAILGACGGVATSSNNSAESAAQGGAKAAPQARSGAGGDSWVGDYAGDGDGGGTQFAVRAGRVTGTYAVTGELVGDGEAQGCAGEISGNATAAGSRLTLVVPIPEDSMQCRVTFTRQGTRVQVEEENCSYFHGMSCGFSGNVSRRRSAAAAPAPVPAAGQSMLGAWVQEGGYCASGDPIVFETGGGYRNSGGEIEGDWSLSGETLTVRFAEIDPTTGRPEGARQTAVMRVTRVNANEIRLDGTPMRRCPANGGAEPWHPGERFTTQ